jgi:hypothetical protein
MVATVNYLVGKERAEGKSAPATGKPAPAKKA